MTEQKVNKAAFKKFIDIYIRTFQKLISDFSEENKTLFFPEFLISPHKIVGVISATHGVSIEFIEKAEEYSLKLRETAKPIEEEVLPQTRSKWVLFQGEGKNVSIENMSLVTYEFKELYERNNLIMSGGTRITASKPGAGFVKVIKGGDVRFHTVFKGKPIERDARCLWIFGSNLSKDFNSANAKVRAEKDFNHFLYLNTLHMPKFVSQEEKHIKLEALGAKLRAFKALLNLSEVKESQLQKFFEENKEFLKFGGKYKEVYPQISLRDNGKPDFFLERSNDSYCDLLDIKLPDKKLIVGPDGRRKFSSDVESAIAQMREYMEFCNDPLNQEWLKEKYGIRVYKPDRIILIGKSEDLDPEERIRISHDYPNSQITTFEDIISQMEQLLKILK